MDFVYPNSDLHNYCLEAITTKYFKKQDIDGAALLIVFVTRKCALSVLMMAPLFVTAFELSTLVFVKNSNGNTMNQLSKLTEEPIRRKDETMANHKICPHWSVYDHVTMLTDLPL